MRKNKRYTTKQAGFSLMEIIIVIALIGTLMAIIISRISGGSDNAKKGITDTKAYTLQSKLIQYQLSSGSFPSSSDGLQVLLQPSGGVPIAGADDLKDGWGVPFDYQLTGQGPEIISHGSPQATDKSTAQLCYLNGTKTDCSKISTQADASTDSSTPNTSTPAQ